MTDNRLAILLTGIGIGAAAGLLLARTSGADLRKGIRKGALDATDYLKDQAEELVDRAGSVMQASQDRFASELGKAKGEARDLGNRAKAAIGDAAGIAASVAGRH